MGAEGCIRNTGINHEHPSGNVCYWNWKTIDIQRFPRGIYAVIINYTHNNSGGKAYNQRTGVFVSVNNVEI